MQEIQIDPSKSREAAGSDAAFRRECGGQGGARKEGTSGAIGCALDVLTFASPLLSRYAHSKHWEATSSSAPTSDRASEHLLPVPQQVGPMALGESRHPEGEGEPEQPAVGLAECRCHDDGAVVRDGDEPAVE